jgi:hypothetical protein
MDVMPKKESLEDFVKNLGKFDNLIQRRVIGDWNKNTLLTMTKSQLYSPVKTGHLQGSARRLQATITPTGIKSSFIFGVPYASKLNKGKDEVGRKLNIRTTINPFAQSGYADRGVKETEDFYIQDLDKAISIAFNKV